ncbi:MAG: phosphoenolpyruvate synthase, partial [Actinomycetota bacterium]|nr:phosphoenolpyruvate synthase [Actinomycetota bacterium]
MKDLILDLKEIGTGQGAVAGGKATNLGILMSVDGIRVPAGFCVTTAAFRRIIDADPATGKQLELLAEPMGDDSEQVRDLSARIRSSIEQTPIPDDLRTAVTGAYARLGEQTPCAVRSSATAEDLPSASFAGQQDSFLYVSGPDAILESVSRCWASLFTERAVAYRQRNGFDQRSVAMAVIVQRMVP